MEKKINVVLEKLEHIEELLTINEDIPDEDELEQIMIYLKKKKEGNLNLSKLEDVIDEL